MKTIAQQLEITEFPFIIKDNNGKQLYYEASDGYWEKRAYNSNGYEIYYEDSDGYWAKREYNSDGHLIYYENSDGDIEHNRPKDDVITLNGIKYKRIEQ